MSAIAREERDARCARWHRAGENVASVHRGDKNFSEPMFCPKSGLLTLRFILGVKSPAKNDFVDIKTLDFSGFAR